MKKRTDERWKTIRKLEVNVHKALACELNLWFEHWT